MRFMIIVKATPQSEAGALPGDGLIAALTDYHEQLARAGVLLDGPFAEPRALVAGYTLIQVHSREEALDWTRRFPVPADDGADGEIEVRPLAETGDR